MLWHDLAPMKVALSIAGSDPSGGGGLQADLQVFRHFGVHGCGVVTAMTVQDTERVHQSLPAFPNVVLDQLRVLVRDLPPDVVKLGMLATDDVLRNVTLGLGVLEPGTPLVVDPVMLASDGTRLLEQRAYGGLRQLVGMSTLVTPNLPEAEALAERDVSTEQGVEAAATELVSGLGAKAALVKGGHRDGAPDDLLALREDSGVRHVWLRAERIERTPARGTGCVLSSAIAAQLANEVPLEEAVAQGRAFLRRALEAPVADGSRGRLLPFG